MHFQEDFQKLGDNTQILMNTEHSFWKSIQSNEITGILTPHFIINGVYECFTPSHHNSEDDEIFTKILNKNHVGKSIAHDKVYNFEGNLIVQNFFK